MLNVIYDAEENIVVVHNSKTKSIIDSTLLYSSFGYSTDNKITKCFNQNKQQTKQH